MDGFCGPDGTAKALFSANSILPKTRTPLQNPYYSRKAELKEIKNR
jgi:hypothetical protein